MYCYKVVMTPVVILSIYELVAGFQFRLEKISNIKTRSRMKEATKLYFDIFLEYFLHISVFKTG